MMTLKELLRALREENGDYLTIHADGSAVLAKEGQTFKFKSIADLEKGLGSKVKPLRCGCGHEHAFKLTPA